MAAMNTNTRFLDACRRRPTDVRPVWFMRQAGRYLRQYREIRAKHGILEMCKRPDLAAAVTLQPVEILDVDAAIIFADLLLPVEPMGLKLRYATGEGPVIDNPVRTEDDVDSLSTNNTDDLGYVGEAIQTVVRALAGRVPVIGFVGAPFTLASYMIEGGAFRAHQAPDVYRRDFVAAFDGQDRRCGGAVCDLADCVGSARDPGVR
jgi:uroporphyrinogen decarboxylase